MSAKYKPVPMSALKNKTIVDTKHGVPKNCDMRLSSYQACTIKTETGETYVIWNSMGELNLSQILEEN